MAEKDKEREVFCHSDRRAPMRERESRVYGRGHKGLVARTIRYGAMRFHWIGGNRVVMLQLIVTNLRETETQKKQV